MEWRGDLGIELYVATERYPDRQQYIDSEQALKLVRQYRLEKSFSCLIDAVIDAKNSWT